MLRPSLLLFVVAALGVTARTAGACGHCVEDHVAAVYDYGMQQQAGRAGLEIAYLGIEGSRAESPRAAALVGDALRGSRLIAAGTVRTSFAPPAAAFAWSGGDPALRAILESIRATLADNGLHLELLRVWNAERGLH